MEWYENRILSAKNGTNPMVMVEMKAGFAVFGDVQFLPGYCVLLPKHEIFQLNELPLVERTQFLSDMALLGDAIIAACKPLRVNYDVLGNSDQFLHAHIFPRYDWEEPSRRAKPVWLYDEANWYNEDTAYQPENHDELRNRIKEELVKLMTEK
ncbi:MAG: hypothetical protein FWH31_09170 [Streptococcaceae bacterium]|nr:hypothetical protein [Streptococcaceae bacterium]